MEEPRFVSKKPMVWMLVGVIIVFGGIFGWNVARNYFIKQFFKTYAPPPQAINTIATKKVSWQPYLEAVGNVTAFNGVDLSPEASGQVKSVFFKSGQLVKAGSPLIQLDDASERAQLADINAQLQLAQMNLSRSEKLYTQRATPLASLDDSRSKVKQLKANQENMISAISKKLLKAPFSGKLGIKQVNVGQFINAGQSCVSLQASAALYVKFSLPQQDIPKISSHEVVKVSTDSYADEEFSGYVTAVDSKVDDNTRTIEVQAAVDNSLAKLYPGMFVNVKVFLPSLPNTVVLPQSAVNFTLYGDSVFVVTLSGKKDKEGHELGKVKQVFVKTGDKQNNLVVITEGLKAGDVVASSGQSKLQNETPIFINNSNPI